MKYLIQRKPQFNIGASRIISVELCNAIKFKHEIGALKMILKNNKAKIQQIMNKTISSMLVVVVMLSITAPTALATNRNWLPPAESIPFTDAQSHWGREHIAWAYANGITSGTSATRFSPNSHVTRGQFITFLHRMAGEPTAEVANPFDDVLVGEAEQFYSRAVMWGYETGVITGISYTSFAPYRQITRAEIATMIHRHFKDMTNSYDAPDNALNRFVDNQNVPHWAVESLKWAAHNRIIAGANGMLLSRNNATRAEAITMLHRTTMDISMRGTLLQRRPASCDWHSFS